MNESDERLRRGLQLLAEEAPSSLDAYETPATSSSRTAEPRRTALVSLAAAAVVAGLVTAPLAISRMDSSKSPAPPAAETSVPLRIMTAEHLVLSKTPFTDVMGTLGKDSATGCLELDGQPLWVPVGSNVVDDSTVEIYGLGVVKLGDTIAGKGREFGIARGVGRPEELAADQYLACMGDTDRVRGIDFRP